MNSEQNLQNDPANEASLSSFDDFLKELEEAEKSLSISDDLEIEVEDFEDGEPANFEVQSAAEEFALETFAAPELKATPVSDLAAKQELQKLHIKVSTLEEERSELKNILQRRQNDFDSFRKRTERERSETFENILCKLSGKMLPVIDNLSRALESADNVSEKSKEFERFVEGILLVNQQLVDVLAEMGIQPILSTGKPFDPHFHEAVATVEDRSVESGTVIEEVLTGYTIGKKVVRPAMVRVSVAPNGAAAETVEEEAEPESTEPSTETANEE